MTHYQRKLHARLSRPAGRSRRAAKQLQRLNNFIKYRINLFQRLTGKYLGIRETYRYSAAAKKYVRVEMFAEPFLLRLVVFIKHLILKFKIKYSYAA